MPAGNKVKIKTSGVHSKFSLQAKIFTAQIKENEGLYLPTPPKQDTQVLNGHMSISQPC